jgi:hypothetical protein
MTTDLTPYHSHCGWIPGGRIPTIGGTSAHPTTLTSRASKQLRSAAKKSATRIGLSVGQPEGRTATGGGDPSDGVVDEFGIVGDKLAGDDSVGATDDKLVEPHAARNAVVTIRARTLIHDLLSPSDDRIERFGASLAQG